MEELVEYRLDSLDHRTEDLEHDMGECRVIVVRLTTSVEALVESNHLLADRLEAWTMETQGRMSRIEAQVEVPEKMMTTTMPVTNTPTDLAPPTPGTPAYYLAVLLRYGGMAGALIAGLAVVIVGGIWALNHFGIL